MIAYFCKKKEGHFWAKTDPFCPLFAPFLRICIPAGYPAFALRRRVQWLEKRGIRRYIADRELFPPKALEAYGLKEVDPLPLCRAKAAQLALARQRGKGSTSFRPYASKALGGNSSRSAI